MKIEYAIFVIVGTTLYAQQSDRNLALPHCDLPIQTIVVKLLSPISTATSKSGDAFTTSVEVPATLAGGIIEGRILNVKKPAKGLGQDKPNIQLQFSTLTIDSRSCALSADLHQVANSKGVANVDEEGRVIGRTSNGKRVGATVGGAVLGGLLGAMRGGAAGATIGSAAGAVVGFSASSTLTSVGINLEFRPGSTFTLQITRPSS